MCAIAQCVRTQRSLLHVVRENQGVVVGLDLKWFVRRKRVDLGVLDILDYPDGFAKKNR
jgi:hypothetical protein